LAIPSSKLVVLCIFSTTLSSKYSSTILVVTTASASLHWNLIFYFYDARVKKRREYVHHGVNDVKVLEVIVYIWRRWRGDKCLACACGHGRGRMGHVNVMGPLCVAQNPRWIAASTLVLPPPRLSQCGSTSCYLQLQVPS